MRERLLIVGNGMAGVRLCEELAARAPGRHAVTVVGAEARPGYNRVLLSSLLADEVSEAETTLRDAGWYAAQGIELFTGAKVSALDAAAGEAALDDGRRLAFDRVVLATGSDPMRLPLPGAELPGVMTFRDLCDVARMRAMARPGVRAVVIGGGLLGLEAAWGLRRMGADVTVVHLMDRLMERQLDGAGARILRRLLERKGLRFVLGADSAAIEGDESVAGLRLKDGRLLPAEMVVMAVGIRPNVSLARASGLAVGRGVVVDDRMAASLPRVHAIGECAEHRGVVYGLVEPAYRQAETLARTLAGEDAVYAGTMLSTNLKVSGVGVFSAGDMDGHDGARVAVVEDAARGLYRKAVIRPDGAGEMRLAGAILVGDIGDAIWCRNLIAGGADISDIADDLVFGSGLCGADVKEAA
jgi:nitrite reductase (NADH) large subunit